MNQQPIKSHLIHPTISHSAVGYHESSVVTVQSNPFIGGQLVAIVVPGQSSEEIADVNISIIQGVVIDASICCDLHLQGYIMQWCELYSAGANNVQQTYMRTQYSCSLWYHILQEYKC